MSEMRQGIRTVRDVGYRVIMRKEDGSPRLVWRCFVKEGQYGKFISIEQHWVQRMEGKKIIESQWAKKRYSFPHDREKAFEMLKSLKELVEEAFAAGPGAKELEKEVEEEFGEELEGFEEEL